MPLQSRSIPLVLALALIACTPDAPQSQIADARTPSKQSASLEAADPQQVRYDAIKDTLQGMHDEGLTITFGSPYVPMDISMDDPLPEGDGCIVGRRCVLDLIDCGSMGSEYLGVDLVSTPQNQDPRLANIAYEVIRLESILGDAGYPPDTWRALVSNYETSELQALRNPAPVAEDTEWGHMPGAVDVLYESLKSTLNAYRANTSPSLPELITEGGCGAGDIGIHVATTPANGHARFIPVFYHRLCRAQGLNPDDTAACDHWKEPADGVLFDVAGDYRYRVDWPDGSKREGKFSFTNLEDGQTVTIRKQ